MQTLKRDELAFLSVVGYPSLTRKALRLYAGKTILFNKVYSPHLYVMWDAFMEILLKHREEKTNASRDIIAAGISEAMESAEDMPEEFKTKCDQMMQRLLIGEIPTETEGEELLKYLIQLDTNRRISNQVTMNAGIEELQRTLEFSKRALEDITPEKANNEKVLYNPLSEIESLAVKAERIPTGINWLDVASNGGGRAGELWLILGPSGGGKSMCAVQFSCAQALMGNNVLWATYEQSLEGDISERIISNITDTSLDIIRDKGFLNLPEAVQKSFWTAVAGVSDKLKVLDMTHMRLDPTDPKDNGGMYTVWRYIKELKEQGTPVKTIIIDWVGAMMSLVGAVTGKDLTKGYRFYTQAEIDIARKIVKEENVQIIFFHQTDSKSQNARPTFAPDKTAAKDMKDMSHYMDLVFTMGNRDKNNICWFTAAKSRKGQSIQQTIQLIGDKSRFQLVKGWMPNRDGNFYKPAEDENADDDELTTTVSEFTREIS